MSTNLRLTGRSTSPDVDRLIEVFPSSTLQAGFIVEYHEIAQIISTDKTSNRFNTVVNAWKKRIYRDFNIVVEAVPNKGFLVLSNSGRIGFSSNKVSKGFKRILKGKKVALTTSNHDLDEQTKRIQQHIINVGGAIEIAMATEKKRLEYSLN